MKERCYGRGVFRDLFANFFNACGLFGLFNPSSVGKYAVTDNSVRRVIGWQSSECGDDRYGARCVAGTALNLFLVSLSRKLRMIEKSVPILKPLEKCYNFRLNLRRNKLAVGLAVREAHRHNGAHSLPGAVGIGQKSKFFFFINKRVVIPCAV